MTAVSSRVDSSRADSSTAVSSRADSPTADSSTAVSSRADSSTAVSSTAVSSRVEALEQLARSFKTAMAAVRRLRGRETHHPGELSYAQYALLFSLADSGGELSVRELACAADLAPPSVTQMLDHLADMGLVARMRSELDKRVVLTSLTDRGRALIVKRRALFEPRWSAALAEFDDHELGIAAAVLARLGAMFDDFAGDA